MELSVRDATVADAAACAAVYAPYVSGSAVSFELEPPTAEELGQRIEAARRQHAWVVLQDESGRVRGYASAAPWKSRGAYRHTAEVGVYLEPGLRRRGGGRALYEALFARLRERGFRTVVAGMSEPNEPSTGLHLAMGFQVVGTLRQVGWKDDRWWDVTLFQRDLGVTPGHPPAWPSNA
jgi:phosphinothricin acetyltransferase